MSKDLHQLGQRGFTSIDLPVVRKRKAKGFTLVELPARKPKPAGRRQVRSAFTLIELLVVIAILSLLLSILVPTLRQAKVLARRAACAVNLRNMAASFMVYTHDNDTLPGCVGWGYSTAGRHDYHKGTGGGTSVPLAWQIVHEGGYLMAAALLGCPARPRDGHFFGDPVWFGVGPGTHYHTHYCYRANVWAWDNPVLNTNTALALRSFWRVPGSSALLYDMVIHGLHWPGGDYIAEAYAGVPNPDNWPHVTGGNVARFDTSVLFLPNAMREPPDQYVGWPISRHTDLGPPDFDVDPKKPATTVPAFLDRLIK